MFFWLLSLTVVFLVVGVCNTDAAGRVNSLGAISGFLAFICVISALVVLVHDDNAKTQAEHARIEKQVKVPELNKYYGYNTKIQDNGKTIIIETTEASNAENIAKIKNDLSKSDKIKDVQFLSNSDKHARIILIVKLK